MNLKSPLVEVHIVKRNNSGIKFLILKRNKKESFPGVWQMVNGNIRDGEKAYEAALREVEEETGLRITKLWSIPNTNSFYSPEEDSLIFIPVFLAEVDKNSEVIISAEHTEFKWVTNADANKMLIWEGQRTSVKLIYQYLNFEGETLNFNEISFNTD